MPAQTMEDQIRHSITASISQAVEIEREEVIQLAVKDFEQRIRKAAGLVSIELANYFSVQRMGPDLVIHVRIESDGQEGRNSQ